MTNWPQFGWLREWSSIIALKLTFDNRVLFNPGVSLNTPMVNAHPAVAWGQTLTIGQSYSLGLGGHLEGDMGRSEEVAFFYPFADFSGPPDPNLQSCYWIGGLTITGDLKLRDWLDDVLEPVRRCAFAGQVFQPHLDESSEGLKVSYPPSCPPPVNPITT